jgi:pyruvate ferredoxin oxidoreductase gamma subunit
MQKIKGKTVEMRWHGRGGQGAVTSAELVALAAIKEGKFAQAFPSFGPERRGAPVMVFNRVSATEPVRNRAGITAPDIVVVLDPGLLGIVNVTSGLKDDGILIVNSPKPAQTIKSEVGGKWKLVVVNAGTIAKELLGVNIVNTTMIGAVIKATGLIKLESLTHPVEERFGKRAKDNLAAAKRAFNDAVVLESDPGVPQVKREFPVEVLPGWKEIPLGMVVTDAGNASFNKTGDWRSQRPVWNHERCIKCGICYLFCPEACIGQNKEGFFEANLYYCKGCGICSRECPTESITMTEESV